MVGPSSSSISPPNRLTCLWVIKENGRILSDHPDRLSELMFIRRFLGEYLIFLTGDLFRNRDAYAIMKPRLLLKNKTAQKCFFFNSFSKLFEIYKAYTHQKTVIHSNCAFFTSVCGEKT